MKMNIQYNLCFQLIWHIYIYIYIYIYIIYIYIYIYIILLNTLSGGKSCLVVPGVAVPPWATKTVITTGWRLIRAGYCTCFHTYDEKKMTFFLSLNLNMEHPWCNGYHYSKWTWQPEFKSWIRLFAFHIALICFALRKQLVWENENLNQNHC